MADTNEPIDGEITTPDGKVSQPPAKRGTNKTRKGFGRDQSDAEREQETKNSDPFQQVVLLGRSWWDRDGFEPSDEQRKMVQMLKFSGYTDEQIAGGLHMSVETLIKHFAFELTNAKMLIMGDLATRAYTRARQGNDVLTMFLMKTRSENGAFSEKASTAAAITDSLKDVDALSDDKKASVIAALVDLMNPKRAAPEKDGK
jgi:hypothetical protein